MRQFLNNQRIVGAIFLGVFAGYLWSTTTIYLDFWSEGETFNARSMPYFIGGLGVVISLLLIFLPGSSYDWSVWKHYRWKPAAGLLLCMTLFSFGIEFLGFVLGSCLLLLMGFVILGERRLVLGIGISIMLVVGFWGLMKLLGIYLAPGDIWQVFS